MSAVQDGETAETTRALIVACLVSALLSGIDVLRASAETDTWRSPQSLWLFSVLAFSSLFALSAAWLTARVLVRRLCLARGRRFVPVPGFVDGAVIAASVLAEPVASLGGSRVVIVAVSVPSLFALWSVVRERWPALRVPVGALGTLLCAWIVLRMPDRGRDWLRCGVDLSLLLAASEALTPLLTSRAVGVLGRSARVAVTGSVLLALVGQLVARGHEPLRRLIQERSLHTLALSCPLQAALDPDGDDASWLHGGHDCAPFDGRVFPFASEVPGDGVDQNCLAGDGATQTTPPRVASSARGAAKGADVFVLSVDALRWDLVNNLTQTRAALGAHAQMTLATSPAPKTPHTFGALWRGRVLRGVEFEPREYRTLPADAPKTLAHVATAAGYRAVMVPTHRYLAPETLIGDGFEMSVPSTFHSVLGHSARQGGIVRVKDAYPVLLKEAAKDTSRPLLAWLHSMETHDPYFTDAGPGPGNATGQQAAVRELDRKLAALIAELRRVRGNRPMVVAIVGDHGEEHGEHGARFHATSVHAEQVRVGFLLSGPGIPSRRVSAPVSIAQLTPTLAELMDLPLPDSFTEPSLLACIVDNRGCPEVAASELESEMLVGYTTARYRLIHDASHRIERLYDHTRDPYEQHDLAAERPADLAKVRALAHAWNERH